jgi:hypothetical protein
VSITRLDARHAWEMELLVPGLATACARHQQSANSSQAHTKPPDPVRTWGNRLLALAPAVSGLVAIPRAAVFTMLEHQRDTVLRTEASKTEHERRRFLERNLASTRPMILINFLSYNGSYHRPLQRRLNSSSPKNRRHSPPSCNDP